MHKEGRLIYPYHDEVFTQGHLCPSPGLLDRRYQLSTSLHEGFQPEEFAVFATQVLLLLRAMIHVLYGLVYPPFAHVDALMDGGRELQSMTQVSAQYSSQKVGL